LTGELRTLLFLQFVTYKFADFSSHFTAT
jgi:hypothetical protein